MESPAGAAGPLVSLALSCCGPCMALVLREASHGCSCTLEILPAGSRHAAPLCRSGALSFRSAKPQRGSRPESIPSHGRSEVTGRGFPAFGRILLNGSRPAAPPRRAGKFRRHGAVGFSSLVSLCRKLPRVVFWRHDERAFHANDFCYERVGKQVEILKAFHVLEVFLVQVKCFGRSALRELQRDLCR